MKIKNSELVHGTDQAIEEFRVFSRVLENRIDWITHCVYTINKKDDRKLLELQRKYRELMEDFENLQI